MVKDRLRLISILISFCTTLAFINFAVNYHPLLRRILTYNPVGYFYVGHDWNLKISRVLLGIPENSILFLGTSRTVYAIDPRQFRRELTQNYVNAPSIENLGLFASSQVETRKLLELLKQKNYHANAIFLEFNPVALSDKHIEMTERANYAEIFDLHRLERWIPISSWLTIHVPLFRYQNVLYETISRLGRTPLRLPSDIFNSRKNFHLGEFFKIDDDSNLGFLGSEISDVGSAREDFLAYMNQECLRTGKWAIQDSSTIRGRQEFERSLELAREISPKVMIWQPPESSQWHSIVGARTKELIAKLISPVNDKIRFVDLSESDAFKAFSQQDEELIDCMHVSKKGAKDVTAYLASVYLSSLEVKK